MNGSGKGADQSMDEILASIKRIITDDVSRPDGGVAPGDAFAAKDIDYSLDSLLKSMNGHAAEASKTAGGQLPGAEPRLPPLPQAAPPVAGSAGSAGKDPPVPTLPVPTSPSPTFQVPTVQVPTLPVAAGAGPAAPVPKAPPPTVAAPTVAVAAAAEPASAKPAAAVPVSTTSPQAARAPVDSLPPSSTLEAIRQRARRAAGLVARGVGGGEPPDSFAAEAAQPVVSANGTLNGVVAGPAAPAADSGGKPESGPAMAATGMAGAGPGLPAKAGEALAATAAAVSSLAGGGMAAAASGGHSLEDTVKELLRPMLRQWLDDNLKGIVEQVVREEFAKRQDKH